MAKFKEIIKSYKESKSSSVTIYVILRVLVVACIIGQAVRGNWSNVFLCVLALLLFLLPIIIQSKLKIKLPTGLEIVVFLFIFSGTVLGEILNFYEHIPFWDTLLHTLNGFLCAGVGFALVDLLNENSKKVKLSPLYISLVAFCFSMTIGVCWEFFEHTADRLLLSDMQKDTIVTEISTVELDPLKSNTAIVIEGIDKTVLYDKAGNELATIEGGYLDIGLYDTMKDLFVNLIGAIVFAIFGYFYTKNREKYKFAKNFIPEKQIQ